MKIRLTEKTIDKLRLPPGKRQERFWDTELEGFGLVLSKTSAAYVLRQTRADGTERQEVIGQRGEMTLDEAQKRVQVLKGQIAEGKATPGDDLRLATKGPTLREAIASYLAKMKTDVRRPTAIKSVRAELLEGRHLADWLDRPLRKITPWDARDRHVKISLAGKHTANRIMINFGAVWNMVADECVILKIAWPVNPTQFVHWFSKNQPGYRKRRKEPMPWSTLPEWKRRVDALKNPAHRLIYYVALFTGLRKSCLFTLRWDQLNLSAKPITIKFWTPSDGIRERELAPFSVFRPCPKGGHDKAYAIPLPQMIVDMLLQHHAARKGDTDNGWVFPGKSYRGAECWRCADLNLPAHVKGVVSHMFHADGDPSLPSFHRHRDTWATATKELKPAPMPQGMVQRFLNHADKTVTDGYIAYSDELLAEWQEKQCAFLLSMIRGERHLRSVA